MTVKQQENITVAYYVRKSTKALIDALADLETGGNKSRLLERMALERAEKVTKREGQHARKPA